MTRDNLTIQHRPGYTRRGFLIDCSLASVSVLLGASMLGGCEAIEESIQNRPTRRRIRNNAAANKMVAEYSDAVAKLIGLPSSDPRNWTKQAEIHNNHCPHGNWFFFPWHRAYLVYFERICQKQVGDPNFVLPYWDWCVDLEMPAAYWNPSTGNPLYDSTRSSNNTDSADPGSVGLTLVDGFCNEPDFNIFAGGVTTGLRTGGGSYGNIEGTPHNYIHGTFVQGDMSNFMSPIDPIFWNHHCMIDLCWFEWNFVRRHANTNDTRWVNFDLGGYFFDADGNPVTTLPLIITPLFPLLSYQYETGIDGTTAPTFMSSIRSRSEFERLQDIVRQGAHYDLNVRQRYTLARGVEVNGSRTTAAAIKVDASQFSQVFAADGHDRVLLTLKNVSHPMPNDVFIRVFLDLPDASAETTIEDPHYAGSFYFFTHNHMGGTAHGDMALPDYIVDLTACLKRLHANGNWEVRNKISIDLVAVPIGRGKAMKTRISVEGLELLISTVNAQLMSF
jgi:tyrosinase